MHVFLVAFIHDCSALKGSLSRLGKVCDRCFVLIAMIAKRSFCVQCNASRRQVAGLAKGLGGAVVISVVPG